jgi:glycogen operon protein
MATLLLSLGVPMLTAGDEFGRTQGGNNNAYCQDNGITWLDWEPDGPGQEMLAATKRLIRIRKDFLSHQPSSYPARGESSYLRWYNAAGQPMTPEEWRDPHNRVLSVVFGSPGGRQDGLVVFNASPAPVQLTLPVAEQTEGFDLRMTTAAGSTAVRGPILPPGADMTAPANSMSIFKA